MKTMIPDPIASLDSYATPADKPVRGLARILPVSPLFYMNMVDIFLRAGRLAKRGRYGDDDWVRSSRAIFERLEAVGCRIDVTGMLNLHSAKDPVVFIGNHMSMLETLVLPMLIQPVKACTFIIKPSLVDYPVFGHVMRSRNPVVVSRDNPRQDLITVLEEGTRRLDRGISIIIFPQKTRAATFSRDEFNSLGVKLARRAGVKAMPFALKTDAWSNGRMLKDFGPLDISKTVYFAFGEAMPIEGNGKEENEVVMRFIEEHLERWK